MQTALAILLLATVCGSAEAAIKTQNVDYKSGDVALQGYLAYDDAVAGKRPGVLVFPEWWGLNDYPKERARALAEMGYVAFAADMYGKGVVATSPDEAGKLAGQFRANWEQGGQAEMRQRAAAGLAVLAKQPQVDPARLAAIGYCFGGTVALELAYSGADLSAAVTFHGGLTVPPAADRGRIRAHLLILHGASDANIKPETIAELQKALTDAGVDWEMVYYGGAVHGFSNPANTSAYQPRAAQRSWQTMQRFLAEVLAP